MYIFMFIPRFFPHSFYRTSQGWCPSPAPRQWQSPQAKRTKCMRQCLSKRICLFQQDTWLTWNWPPTEPFWKHWNWPQDVFEVKFGHVPWLDLEFGLKGGTSWKKRRLKGLEVGLEVANPTVFGLNLHVDMAPLWHDGSYKLVICSTRCKISQKSINSINSMRWFKKSSFP